MAFGNGMEDKGRQLTWQPSIAGVKEGMEGRIFVCLAAEGGFSTNWCS